MGVKEMTDFKKEENLKKYDQDSIDYIVNHNLTSIKEYCTCGAFSKEFIRHQSYCPQQQEVMKWKNNR
jgi:hypothetical protein